MQSLFSHRVYFTDRGGRVVHVATDCERPRCPAVTSWGHVLIADYGGHEIKVFSEVGDYLGRLQDNSGADRISTLHPR